MSKYISIDSKIIYDKFVNNYKNSNKYELDKNYIKKDNIYITSFSKLFCIYVIICLAILIIVKLSSYKVFGGITIKKLFIIFGAILFIFVLLYMLAIIDFTRKKEEYLATLSLWDALSEENILGSKNCLEIIDFLYENNNEVGSFYIKLFNIIKSSVIVGYSKWLITLFIGFYTGILSSIFMKYIDKEAGKDLLNYISLIGKELLSILMIILFFSILYYICIHMVYKDESREHDLYVLSLKKVKYILLQENEENKKYIQNLIDNPKEYFMVNKAENNTDNGNKKLKKSDRYLHLFLIFSIIFISLTFVYIIVYFNSDSKLVRSPKLLLFFYIILIFINLIFRILNNLLYPDLNKINKTKNKSNNIYDGKNFKCKVLKYLSELIPILLVSKLLIFLNSTTIENIKNIFHFIGLQNLKNRIPSVISEDIMNYIKNLNPKFIVILIILIIIVCISEQFIIYLENHGILEK